MSSSRRSFLRILGSSAVIVAAGGGTFVASRTPSKALEPWDMAGRAYQDPRKRALSHAILAPNPHNRQPWQVDLGSAEEIILYCDPDRRLPETDPFNRQIAIGLGCFLELLRMAAAEEGHEAVIDPFPDGSSSERIDERPVARIRFRRSDTVSADPLFRHVLDRRSNKEPYDTTRPVGDDVLRRLVGPRVSGVELNATNDEGRVAAFRDLTRRAMERELITHRTNMESVRLMRIGKAEIEANPDGIDIGGAFPEVLSLIGLLSREQIADPGSEAFRQGLDMLNASLESAMAHLWLTTDGNGRHDQLNAGKAWLRINLMATGIGLGIHPLSQALQEYPEMSDLHAEIRQGVGAEDGQTLQMFGRLGYGPKVPPSPRWRLDTRIMTS